MRDLKGKTAFVTGGASGIGLAMARAFGRAGMNVMLADIEPEPLAAAVEGLEGQQIRASGLVLDVSDRSAMEAAAAKTLEAFGKVHVVCNNAGVGAGGPIDAVPHEDWDWIVGVNLMGVVYGTEAFLPHIRAHGEGGHFVNTASLSGLISAPGMEPYSATKYAVVALTEGWSLQLAPENIGVSVLCPGFVRTRIDQSGRARPARYGGPKAAAAPGAASDFIASGLDPDRVGERVREAVEANELYIFTHADMRHHVEQRFQRIMAGFDSAEASQALAGSGYRSPTALSMLQD